MLRLATRTALAAFALLIAGDSLAMADGLENAGTAMAVALPVVAGGIAVYKDDWIGVAQLGVGTVATVGTAYGLKQFVREKRPDGSDFESFPSDTTALAASGSSFLWARYGWRYGLPAFVATQFVSYTRVHAKKHHWYDTLASSGIAFGYAWLLDTRYQEPRHFYSSLSADPDGAYIHMSYNF